MEKITNKRIKEDLEKIAEMLADYNSDIWCRQEGDRTMKSMKNW